MNQKYQIRKWQKICGESGMQDALPGNFVALSGNYFARFPWQNDRFNRSFFAAG